MVDNHQSLDALCGVLKNDPRPSYHNDPQRVYGMDFDGYKPVEFISMDGYDKKDENTFDNIKVKPHGNPLPSIDGARLEAELKPFSWNVIRLKKA